MFLIKAFKKAIDTSYTYRQVIKAGRYANPKNNSVAGEACLIVCIRKKKRMKSFDVYPSVHSAAEQRCSSSRLLFGFGLNYEI